MKDYIKHLVDCSLAFFIAFFSSILASDDINTKIIIISFSASALIGLLKFREYWNNQILGCKEKVHTIFF